MKTLCHGTCPSKSASSGSFAPMAYGLRSCSSLSKVMLGCFEMAPQIFEKCFVILGRSIIPIRAKIFKFWLGSAAGFALVFRDSLRTRVGFRDLG